MAATAPPNGNRGGYDYRFVKTPPDFLVCTVCFLPSKEPNLSGCCGHTFCKSCVEGSKKFSNICPMCRSEEFVTMLNKQADRQIRSLHVFCTNKEQGCEWQGEVNDITNHLGNCPFQVVQCPYDCGEFMQRQYLFSHAESKCPRRRVSCQYCSDDGEHQFIKGKHKEVCPKFPVPCPNHCEVKSIRRDEVDEHKEICSLEIIQCDYHMVGCKVKMARKEKNKHKQEMMEQHLSLSINEMLETKTQLNSMQNNFKVEVNLQLATVEETIEGLKQSLSANQLEAKMTKDALTQQLVCAEKNLTASQQEAQRTKDRLLQKLTTTEKELNTTKQQLAVTCQNLTKVEKEHTTLAASTDKALTEMEAKFQAKVTEITTAAEKKIAELEIKLISNQWFTSLNCRALQDQVVPVIVNVKISEFTKHEDTIWSSKKFYDSSKEYRIQLQVTKVIEYPSTYLSVHLDSEWVGDRYVGKQVKAKHYSTHYADQKQPARDPLAAKFKVKLLNQISDSEHYLQEVLTKERNKPISNVIPFLFGKSPIQLNTRFISYEDLSNNTATCQYLKDGTLYFEVLESGNSSA